MISIVKLRRIGVTVLSYEKIRSCLRIHKDHRMVQFFTMSVSVNKLTCWWCSGGVLLSVSLKPLFYSQYSESISVWTLGHINCGVLDKLRACVCVCKQRNNSCRLLHTNVRRLFINKNKLLYSYFYHSLFSLKLHIYSKWRSDSVMCWILLILSHWKCHENI